MTTTDKIFKAVGMLVLGMMLIFISVFIYDKVVHKDPEVDKQIYLRKFDSITFLINNLKSKDTILANQINQISININQRDSLSKLDNLKTQNEIIKLKKSSNAIILAVGDSIIRSRLQGQFSPNPSK